MEVGALYRKSAKGEPPERLERLALEAGDPGDTRQISLLSTEAREAVERMGKRGLCMKRFFADLEIDGLPPLEAGCRLAVGDNLLEITDARKKCFAECPLTGADCPLKAGCRFARVVLGGVAVVHDRVSVL